MLTQHGLTRTVAPTVEPLTFEQVRDFARIDGDADLRDITELIRSVRDSCEFESERSLLQQTWAMTLDVFPAGDTIELPRPPLSSVSSVSYIDENGSTQTFSSSDYDVDTTREVGRIRLQPSVSWPTTQAGRANSVTITYVAGYGSAATDVPASLTYAMKKHVDSIYSGVDEGAQHNKGIGRLPEYLRIYHKYRPGHYD